MQLGKQIGKVSAWAGNTDGFVANRSRGPFTAEASILLEDGALPEQVDKVLTDFGYPMGPFAVGDLAGLDIGWAVRKRKAAEDPNFRKNPIADKLCELGRFGQKTGAGWYRYEKGDRTPHPDPIVAQTIKDVTSSLGIKQRSFTEDEILRRLLFASVNEACKILEEKKARRASDVDIMWLYGFGFPRYRGGLMFWADTIGSKETLRADRALAQRTRSALASVGAAEGGRREGRQALGNRDDGVKRPGNAGTAAIPRSPHGDGAGPQPRQCCRAASRQSVYLPRRRLCVLMCRRRRAANEATARNDQR